MKNVTWYGQGSLRIISDDRCIYIDPLWIVEEMHDADIILITHSHFDHLSEDDIKKVIKEDTVFVAPQDCLNQLKAEFDHGMIAILPGEEIDVEEVHIKAVAAYNIIKTQNHPKENNWVGYVIDTDDGKYYYTGDTELIPEMEGLDVDVIFVPLGQVYTMNTVQQAVDAVKASGAKRAVPVHFGKYEGTEKDVQTFQMLLGDAAEMVLLPRVQ